jgi:hypothetical protein
MPRTRIPQTQSSDDSKVNWLKSPYVIGFTSAIGLVAFLFWKLLASDWINTPPKAVEVKYQIEDLKGGLGRVEKRLDDVAVEVKKHGEALSGMQASQDAFAKTQAETNASLRALMLRTAPTSAPDSQQRGRGLDAMREASGGR